LGQSLNKKFLLFLELGLPLAVVPCCVFSHQFPTRRLRSSGQVPTSYEDFCTYLMEKSEALRLERLPFMGKNCVIFTTPPVSHQQL
jgi:hypothetical protein